MGTLTVKQKSLNTQAEYEGGSLRINVSYNEDAITSTLQSLDGNIYHAADSTYAGNFNGRLSDGEIEYSLSQVKSKDFSAVIAALEDIVAQIRAQETTNAGEE